MRHSNTDGHRGILLVALMIGILIGSLIIVSIIRAPVTAIIPNNYGPCTYLFGVNSGVPTAIPQQNIGNAIAGSSIQGTPGQDVGIFMQPLLNILNQIGAGQICFSPNTYNTSHSINITNSGIFLTCQGFSRSSYGESNVPARTPCLIQYTGSSALACVVCWNQGAGTTLLIGGGMQYMSVDGNHKAMNCVAVFNVHDWRFYAGSAMNCINREITLGSNVGGGVTNLRIDYSLIGNTFPASPQTGWGVELGNGCGGCWVTNNWFIDTWGYAVSDTAAISNNAIEFNTFQGCNSGGGGELYNGSCIYAANTEDSIIGNQVTGAGRYCFVSEAYQVEDLQIWTDNICFLANQGDFSDGGCFRIQPVNFNAYNSNVCSDNTGHLLYGFYINNGGGVNNTIIGNTISGWKAGGNAIFFSAGDYSTWTIADNAGFKPPVRGPLTAGASPFTYQDKDGYREQVQIITAGGMTGYTCRGTTELFTVNSISPVLNPGDSCTFTWITTAPTYDILPSAS